MSNPHMSGRTQAMFRLITIVTILILVSLSACAMGPPPEAAVPELTGLRLNHRQIVEGDSKETIAAKLGEPVLRVIDTEHRGQGREEWIYPIRLGGWTYEWVPPAPLLKIDIDATGVVSGWAFVHPVTGEPIAVRETEQEANRWLDGHCGAKWGPRVNLETALQVGVTRKEEVLERLRAYNVPGWARDIPEQVIPQPDPEHGGEVLIYGVDHPSPLYIPAFAVTIEFDEQGQVAIWSLEGYCSAGPMVP